MNKLILFFIFIQLVCLGDIKAFDNFTIYTVTKDIVNIRANPSLTSKILKQLKKDTELEIVSCERNWCKIKKSGYIAQYLLEKKESRKFEETNTTPSQAKILFDNKEYKKAYNLYKKLLDNDLDNLEYHLYLGRSAYKLGYYEEAQILFERILLYDNSFEIAKLELAKSYYALNMYEMSLNILNKIQLDKINLSLKEQIVLFKAHVESKIKTWQISGKFHVGIFYEDNVYNSSVFDSFYIPAYPNINSGVFRNTIDKKSDRGGIQQLSLTYSEKVKQDKEFILDFYMYNKIYRKYNDRQIQFVSLSPKFKKEYSNKLSVNYTTFIDHVFEDSKSSVTSYGFNPSIDYLLSQNSLINFYFELSKSKTHAINNKNEDDIKKSIVISFYKFFINDFTLFQQLKVTNIKEKDKSQEDINRNDYLIRVALQYMINSYISMNTQFRYEKVNFKDMDSLYLKKREDDIYSLSHQIIYKLDEKIDILITLESLRQKSNFDSSTYDKNSVIIAYQIKF